MVERLTLSDRTVDLVRSVAVVGDRTIRLTTKECALLAYLAARPGQTVPRDELLVAVWGYRPDAMTRAVDNMMRKLRAKVEPDPADPRYLITVFGEGYRFQPDPSRLPSPDRGSAAAEGRGALGPVFGRDEVVASIVARFEAGERWITATGPPGIGKSTVAQEVAASADGWAVWRCDLPDVVDASSLKRVAVRAIDCTEGGLASALAGAGRALIVLDRCEGMDGGALAEVEGWLRAAPRLAVLATSRVRIGASVEALVEIGGLDPDGALAMLAQCAARGGASVGEEALRPLAARLQGWPLAIELAAARLRILDVDRVIARLARSVDVLGAPGGAASPPSSLVAAIRSSWDGLDGTSQAVMARCSVFCGGFGVEAAERVAGGEETLDALHRLVDHSLLRRGADGRLAALDAVRSFAAARLDERGEVEATREAHFRWCLAIAHDADRPPIAPHHDRALAEWDNLRAAFAYRNPTDPDGAFPLLAALTAIAGRRGHTSLALDLYQAALAARPSPPTALRLRSAIQHARLVLGQPPSASHRDLIAEAEALGDPAALSRCLDVAAYWRMSEGDPREAEAMARRARDLAAGREPHGEAHGLVCWADLALARALSDQDRYAEAAAVNTAILDRAQRADDRGVGAQAAWNLGMDALRSGHLDRAEAHLDEALRLAAWAPLVALRVKVTQLLAQLAIDRDRRDRARALLQQAEGSVGRIGSNAAVAFQHTLCSQLHLLDGDPAGAIASWSAEAALWQRTNPAMAARSNGQLAMAHRLAGHPRRALALLRAARDGRPPNAPADVELTAERAACHAELGEVGAAVAAAAGAAALGEGPAPARAQWSIVQGHLALARADLAAARTHLAAALEADRTAFTRILARRLSDLLDASARSEGGAR